MKQKYTSKTELLRDALDAGAWYGIEYKRRNDRIGFFRVSESYDVPQAMWYEKVDGAYININVVEKAEVNVKKDCWYLLSGQRYVEEIKNEFKNKKCEDKEDKYISLEKYKNKKIKLTSPFEMIEL